MATLEFEEKSFEQPLNYQLLAGSQHIFAPGQVIEGQLGFDVGMYTHHPGFWGLWGAPRPGHATWWGYLRKPGTPLPRFRLNLFVQHKRPVFLQQANAGQWDHWNGPYYRYDVVPHQQSALERCAQHLGKHGLVVYAAPAFRSMRDLEQFTASGRLVEQTNFVEAPDLSGHGRYTHVSAGANGFAFSEPTEIASIEGLLGLETRIRAAPSLREETSLIRQAAAALAEAARDQELKDNSEQIEERVGEFRRFLRAESDAEVLRAYFRAVRLAWLLGLMWLVGGVP